MYPPNYIHTMTTIRVVLRPGGLGFKLSPTWRYLHHIFMQSRSHCLCASTLQTEDLARGHPWVRFNLSSDRQHHRTPSRYYVLIPGPFSCACPESGPCASQLVSPGSIDGAVGTPRADREVCIYIPWLVIQASSRNMNLSALPPCDHFRNLSPTAEKRGKLA
jgi:hypothetical protein